MEDETGVFADYLCSEIKTRWCFLVENKNRKDLLEIEKLEHDLGKWNEWTGLDS